MATCPECGNGLGDRVKFCSQYGKRVGAWIEYEEYRVITVVFCDVAGSTELERELGRQPMQKLKDRYGKEVRRILGDRGASIGKRQGLASTPEPCW